MPSVAERQPIVVAPAGRGLAVERQVTRRLRLLLAGAALACLATLAVATLPAVTAPSSRSLASHRGLRHHLLARLPSSLTPVASASIGASRNNFWPVRHGADLSTHGGGIRSTFTASGAALRVHQGTADLSLISVGRAQRAQPVAGAAPSRTANEVLYRRGSIVESYRNGPYGLEQAFTVRQRPGGTGALVLAVRASGSLIPKQAGSQILFSTRAGATALRYGQLSAIDATGRRVPAHMQLHRGTLQLWIDDSRARYPLRIDPFVQQGQKLTPVTQTEQAYFGFRVALSSDGNTALIGSSPYNTGGGMAWVFTRSGSTWTQQAQLAGTGGIGAIDEFGASVALSADGNTALIGGPGDNRGKTGQELGVGAAWVFTRSGSTWTQQGSKLTGSGETGEGEFGYSVALSADGSTALIGAPTDNGGVGAAWVFTRSGSAWASQGSKLAASDESGQAGFGYSAALSSSGSTALIGGPSEQFVETGGAWVFTRSGSTWTQQGPKLSAGDSAGWSVALSADGNTALVGGPKQQVGETFNVGSAWVFTRSGSTWAQQGPALTGTGESGEAEFGWSVALSADGNAALIGGPFDNNNSVEGHGLLGAAWVFMRSGSTWAQQGPKLTGSGEGREVSVEFGYSVALSADANTALIGGPDDSSGVGAAWVFTPGGPPVNTVRPQISGTAQVGGTLACSPGTWSGDMPQTYTYTWLRDGTVVSGPSAQSSYTVVAADKNHDLTCEVTAKNNAGSASATSAPVGATPAWQPLGPSSFGRIGNQYNVSGRVTAVVPDPQSPGTRFVATDGGGVWRVDPSLKWTPLSDFEQSLMIGALAIAHPTTGPAYLFAGTGENATQSVSSSEPSLAMGIMRGTVMHNGSVKWSVVEPLPEDSWVGEIAVDSANPHHVLAATSVGLFSSTQDGAPGTWKIASTAPQGRVDQVVQDPSNAAVFLASEVSGAEGQSCAAKIVDSIDGGQSWTPVHTAKKLAGLPSGFADASVGLTIDASGTGYAVITNCGTDASGAMKLLSGIYDVEALTRQSQSAQFRGQAITAVSTNCPKPQNGPSCTFEQEPANNQEGVVTQRGFDNVVAADPARPCSVLVGAVGLYELTGVVSSTGCRYGRHSWQYQQIVGPEIGGKRINAFHEDIHAVTPDAASHTLYIGSDGGLTSATCPGLAISTCERWTTDTAALRPGQSITQFYAGQAVDASHLIGGTQDMGTVSTLGPGTHRGWTQVHDDDGGYSYAAANQLEPQYVEDDTQLFDFSQDVSACHPGGYGFPVTCDGAPVQFPDPPVLVDPQEPSNLIEATDHVSFSEESGTRGSWSDPSGAAGLTLSASELAAKGFTCGHVFCPDTISAVAANWTHHGLDRNPTILSASAFGKVMSADVREGGGQSDITGGLPGPDPTTKLSGSPWVTGIAFNPCVVAPNGCGLSNHEAWVSIAGKGVGGVWHTSDYTQGNATQWTNISESNSSAVTSMAVASTPAVVNGQLDNTRVTVFIGEAIGLGASKTGGVSSCTTCYGVNATAQWSAVGRRLPNAWISELSCSTDMTSLIAWTFGRGAWSVPLVGANACVSKQQTDALQSSATVNNGAARDIPAALARK